MIAIRPATIEDAARIGEIQVTTWRHAYRGEIPDKILQGLNVEEQTAFWREVLEQPHFVFMAENNGAVVGFCSVIASRDADVDARVVAELATLYVLPTHWRRGAGRALCERGHGVAKAAGFREITLWVLNFNAASIRFYESLGYTRDGATQTEPSEIDPLFHYDAIRLRRPLAP